MDAYHFIYGFHDLQHLFIADLAITIYVVELESPVQLILHLASAGDAQCADELLEIYGAAAVRIEHFEDMICE